MFANMADTYQVRQLVMCGRAFAGGIRRSLSDIEPLALPSTYRGDLDRYEEVEYKEYIDRFEWSLPGVMLHEAIHLVELGDKCKSDQISRTAFLRANASTVSQRLSVLRLVRSEIQSLPPVALAPFGQ